jgi:hypothetical protein
MMVDVESGSRHQPRWLNLMSDVTCHPIFLRIGINRCVAIAMLDLIEE